METLGESLASFLVERALDLLLEEVKFIHGVSDQVEEIRAELRRMNSFLIDANATQDESATFHNRVEEIRELSHITEDVIETFFLKVESRRRGESIRNFLRRYICILNECIERHQIGSELQGIKNRISEITKSVQTYDQRTKSEGEGSSTSQKKLQMRRSYSHTDHEEFVGMQENVEKLVTQLVDKSKNCRVVSIIGMGGIGKTTLARKVYKNSRVQCHFDFCVWTCISQQWQTKDVLKAILTKLKGGGVGDMTVDKLVKDLFEVQKNKKCLIVLDDIWSSDAWDCLKHAFPMKETGSKIMLTTRNINVAWSVDKNGFLHTQQLLTHDESWELLQKKAFTDGHKSDPGELKSMMELGRKMAERCEGLPLGVVLLGGILAKKQKLRDWEKVDRNLNSYLESGKGIGETHGSVSEVLALSYNDLPYHLKSCFLCLGNFKEDSDIDVDVLYKIWMAEGLLLLDERADDEETTLMDVAESYLEDLGNRFMVELKIDDVQQRGSFLSCRLHDRMRELCMLKGKEENFLEFINNIRSSSSSSSSSISKAARRLSVYSDTSVSLKQRTTRHLCSLLFSKTGTDLLQAIKLDFKHFKLLRVLILNRFFSPRDKYNLPNEIGSLLHLRYLSIRDSYFTKLPSSLGNLEYLQTLDLGTRSRLRVPNVLSKMKRLVHLYLPRYFDQRNKVKLDGLSNLETLENFNPRLCRAKDLSKLTNLRKLKLIVDKEGCEFEDLEVIIKYLNIASNRLLRYSYVYVSDKFGDEHYEQYSDVSTRLLGCHYLDHMDLNLPIAKLPEYNCFSPRLTKLIIVSTNLSEDPMKTLEKLPKLLSLTIYNFKGQDMVCSTRGFPQLKSLKLRWLDNLENWRVDEGAMLCLTHLTIHNCRKLKMLPDGLKSVTTLEELKLTWMSKAFANRLRVQGGDGKKGEDFYKVEHVPYITLTTEDP